MKSAVNYWRVNSTNPVLGLVPCEWLASALVHSEFRLQLAPYIEWCQGQSQEELGGQ